MKTIRCVLTMLALVLSISACVDPEVVGPNPDPQENKPQPTPVGFPIDLPTSMTIGAGGGTITSGDERISVDIPAGALHVDTDITIQPITNFAPNGNGNAYQLSPEGIVFDQPIRITFKAGRVISATAPPLTGIAFQGTDGIWYSSGKFTWDEVNQTVSTETTHFSGWATFDDLKILPKDEIKSTNDKYGHLIYQLKVDESAAFELIAIRNTDKVMGSSANETDDLTALVPQKRDNELGVIIKQWSVNGDVNGKTGQYGKIIINGPDSVCNYTAPPVQPKASKNPVQLSVNLRNLKYKDPRTKKVFNDLMVSTSIEIIGGSKYNLEIKYENPNISGGLGDFTNSDMATLSVEVKANGEVVASDITNTDGTITPASFTRNACTTTWIPLDKGFPGITVTKATGVIISISGDAGNPTTYLSLTMEGDSQLPKWKSQCGDGPAVYTEAVSSVGLPLVNFSFILKEGVQTLQDPGNIWFATLTPE